MADDTPPDFEGREVHGARTAFSGSVDGGPILADEDEVTMIVRGKVSKVAHTTDSFGVRRRVHSVKVAHSMVADEATSKRLQKQIKAEEDAAVGQESLDNEIDVTAAGEG